MHPTTDLERQSRPNDDWVKTVCRPGNGVDTCRYLTVGGDGWSCAKLYPPLQTQIDARTNMNAKSDNCEGRLA